MNQTESTQAGERTHVCKCGNKVKRSETVVQCSHCGEMMQRIGRDKVYVAAYLYEELLAKYDEATLGRTQRAQYGEGETKFYADKHGSKTVNTFKLDYEQREEVNRLAEEAQIDLDAVLFKLVYERDELRTALRVLVAQVEAEDWEAHRVANGYAED